MQELGKSGLLLSAIGLGCMGIAMPTGAREKKEMAELLSRAVDKGYTFFDTAEVRNARHPDNEELLGKRWRPTGTGSLLRPGAESVSAARARTIPADHRFPPRHNPPIRGKFP